MTPRTCVTCGRRLRPVGGRLVHDPRTVGDDTARRLDTDHRPVAQNSRGAGPTSEPGPGTNGADSGGSTAASLPRGTVVARQSHRPTTPTPPPAWGPPLPFEKRPFDAELARRRGCEVAAGLTLLGEL